MDDLATLQAFEVATDHLMTLTGVRPDVFVADRHPGYRSAGWAKRNAAGREVRRVQHHHAHIASATSVHYHESSQLLHCNASKGQPTNHMPHA
jgi:hydrogenase maturation protein HypF